MLNKLNRTEIRNLSLPRLISRILAGTLNSTGKITQEAVNPEANFIRSYT